MRATPARALLTAGCAFALVLTTGCAEEDETNIDMTDTTAVVDVDPVTPYNDGAMAGDSVDVDGDGDFDEIRGAADATEDAARGAADATEDAARGAADATEDAVRGAADATEDAVRDVADDVEDVVTGGD